MCGRLFETDWDCHSESIALQLEEVDGELESCFYPG